MKNKKFSVYVGTNEPTLVTQDKIEWLKINNFLEFQRLLKISDLQNIEKIFFDKYSENDDDVFSYDTLDFATALIEAGKGKKLPTCYTKIENIQKLIDNYNQAYDYNDYCVLMLN